MRWKTIVLIAAGLVAPLAANAQDERVWLLVNGGGGTYGMSDLNRDITAYNTANAGTGMSFPLVKNGLSLGGAVGFETPSRWNFGIGLDRLQADTKASDANGGLDYQFNADAFRLFCEYSLNPIGTSSVRIGGGAGLVVESGRLTESSPGLAPQDFKISGKAPLYEASIGGDFRLGPQLSLAGGAGYRYAKVDRVQIAGGTLIQSNGQATSIDYSGPFVRIGFRLISKNMND